MNGYVKQGAWIAATLLGWAMMTSPVLAASFDCAKAASNVEKLICGDALLSKLDDELSAVYKTALQDEKQAEGIRQAQRQWVEGRNGCGDAGCLKTAYQTRIQALIVTPTQAEVVSLEADKIKEMQVIIERQGMEIPVRFPSHFSVKDIRKIQRDCGQFLEDFKAGKNIEVIEPILRTDDPNHPDLARYQNACRDNKNSTTNYRDLSNIGTRAFRLYRIDTKGNSKKPTEDILYAEGNPRLSGKGVYRRVDLKQCTIHSFGHPCCNTTLTPSVNAIIRYQGTFYVLDMEGEMMKSNNKELRYGINSWGTGTGAQYQCRFTRPYQAD